MLGVLLTIACFTILAIASSSSDTPKKETEGSSDSSKQEASKNEVFALTETAVFSDLKITANEIKRSNGSEFNKPSSGKTFVGVKFTIENISEEEKQISTLLLFDAYADDVKCDYSIGAALEFSDGTLDGSLSPGKKMVGYYALEVPVTTKKITLEVKSTWLSNSKAEFVLDMPE